MTNPSELPVKLTKIGCFVPTTKSTCKRPVQYVFMGKKGPYYRCGKCGQELIKQRKGQVEVTEVYSI